MTFQQATQREPGAARTAVRGDGFTGIGGTGWIEPAVVPDVGADTPFIQIDDKHKDVFHDVLPAGSAALLLRR